MRLGPARSLSSLLMILTLAVGSGWVHVDGSSHGCECEATSTVESTCPCLCGVNADQAPRGPVLSMVVPPATKIDSSGDPLPKTPFPFEIFHPPKF